MHVGLPSTVLHYETHRHLWTSSYGRKEGPVLWRAWSHICVLKGEQEPPCVGSVRYMKRIYRHALITHRCDSDPAHTTWGLGPASEAERQVGVPWRPYLLSSHRLSHHGQKVHKLTDKTDPHPCDINTFELFKVMVLLLGFVKMIIHHNSTWSS